jgi:Sulfotransferase family
MAIICRAHSLLFIMAPRTGCTAVANLLCQELGGEFLPESDILDARGFAVMRHKHNTLKQLYEHHLLTPDEKNRFFTFTCVRNPYDSLVSLYVKLSSTYQYLLEDDTAFVHRVPGYVESMHWCRTHSFDEWIEERYGPRRVLRFFKKRRRASMYRRYTEGADFVMRFEQLQQDFDVVLQRAGLDPLKIPFFNATPERGSDYRAYYGKRSRELVESALEEDLQRYGYRF